MSKKETKDLERFLQPYPAEVQQMALWLRGLMWDLYPDANELIYDNYNAVAFGWSPTDRLGHTFCSVAVMPRYVHFGFYRGSELEDPEKILLGKGNQYRYIIVERKEDFPKAYMKKRIKEAYANALARVDDKSQIQQGKTIVKSISPVRKRPGIKPPPKNSATKRSGAARR
jgi:hypothetical protein